MKKEDTVRLNTHSLVQSIEELGLKQWWIARQIGVDRKTVSRWVTGRVKRLSRTNALALSELLSCSLQAITISDECDVLATQEEQRTAAALIEKEDLLQILSPTDHWPLAESLIKSSMLPHLPKRQLGQLYNLLSIAAWRQGHYAEGRQRSQRALEIGAEIGDPFVSQKARINLATIESLTGRVTDALLLYEACLGEPESFSKARDRASALSNLGCLYRSVRRFEDSVRVQQQAIDIFKQEQIEFNAAIAYFSLGVVLTEMGLFQKAIDAFKAGQAAAVSAGYTRGIICASLYLCDPLSLKGEREKARELARLEVDKLSDFPVYDLGLRESAARVFRRGGDMKTARKQLDLGLEKSTAFPEIDGFLRHEEARYFFAAGDVKAAKRSQELGNRSFRNGGLELRVRESDIPEYGRAQDTQLKESEYSFIELRETPQ